MDDIAVAVAEHLYLDMARREDVFLDQHAVVAERAGGLALAAFKRVVELLGSIDAAHAFAAAARDRLDQDRIADRIGFHFEDVRRLILAVITRRHRDTGVRHQGLRRVFQAHGADAVRLRPDPDQPSVDHRLREVGILGEEAVARMDRLGARRLRRLDDLLADQIALARRARSDVHRLVRHADVKRLGVGIRIDRDRTDPHRPRGADDSAGDLAAIGDEQRRQHARMFRMFTLTRAHSQCTIGSSASISSALSSVRRM